MDMDKKTYKRMTEAHAPQSPLLKNMWNAFWSGGAICALAQGIQTALSAWCGIGREDAAAWSSMILVLLAAVLSGLGVFDRVAKVAGAGTLVPITGFANAVVSPAIDSRAEGAILGVGAKIFTVAGPVLLYGILAGVLCGAAQWIFALF